MLLEMRYFNEEGEEVEIVYRQDLKKSFVLGTSRGIKWKTQQQKEISFFEKNTMIIACPCISKLYIILIYTDSYGGFEPSKNFCKIVDYEGRLIKNLELPGPSSDLAESYKNKIAVSRFSTAFWETIENKIVIGVSIEMLIYWGWLYVFERKVFDEEKLELNGLIEAWTEP